MIVCTAHTEEEKWAPRRGSLPKEAEGNKLVMPIVSISIEGLRPADTGRVSKTFPQRGSCALV